jgi:hypothetical protein
MITVFNQSETGRSRVLIVGSWRDSCACDRVMSAGAAIAGHSREEFCGQHAVHFPRLRLRNSGDDVDVVIHRQFFL